MVKFKAGPTAKFFITPASEAASFDGTKRTCKEYRTARGGVKRCKKFRAGKGTPTCAGLARKNLRVGRGMRVACGR